MKVKDVLVRARKLIAKGWIQGTYARDKDDLQVLPNDPEACKFCVLGALNRASDGGQDFRAGVDIIESAAMSGPLHTWNDADGTTQEMVLTVFDKAIKAQA